MDPKSNPLNKVLFSIWIMATMNLAIGMIFFLETTAGLLGNCRLVYHFLFLYFTGSTSRSTDLILKHMTLVNLLVLLSKGIPETLAAFGWKHFLNDLGCKLVFYIYRVITWDPSRICDLHHSSQQRQILNPLRKARDRTHILMDASWVH
uniref:Vomeronasal type-1 receptor n=1 Tax=Catagonus wagneri TaxID=51154 RepID=A0A8C3YD51_9CETA